MKLALDCEWISTSMLSTRFQVAGRCELCRRATAGRIWHSLKSGATRCRACFTPEALSDIPRPAITASPDSETVAWQKRRVSFGGAA